MPIHAFHVKYAVGIDGGGTRTRALVRALDDASERSLSRGSSWGLRGEAGPSALGQGAAQAWDSIREAIASAFEGARLPDPAPSECVLCACLSGAEVPAWREAFVEGDPGFARLRCENDSYAALLGAHGGHPGVLVVAGTGVIAESLSREGARRTVGGWGFRFGDEGGGAWVGLRAARLAMSAADGRETAGPLARAVAERVGRSRGQILSWIASAGQFECAQLALLAFELEARDPKAAEIVERAAEALRDLALAADPSRALPVGLAGSVAERLRPRLARELGGRIVETKAEAVEGALALALSML